MTPTDYKVNEFLGLNTRTRDPKNLKKGEAQDSLNWLTGPKRDNIQLRGGSALLGTTRQTGSGKITGMVVGLDNTGKQVPFFSYARKLNYYNGTDTAEVSTTNILPAAASGEDISWYLYTNITGNWVYASSPNSSIYKIHVSFPATVLDLTSTTYRGNIGIDQSRMFLWNTKALSSGFQDKSTLFVSYADHVKLSDYTTVSSENFASGDGSTKTFTATLATIPGANLQTAFAVTVTDGTETFTDNKDGTLTGSLGGTGTVNYISGSVSVTFNTAPVTGVNNIKSTYQREAQLTSIADFTASATRTNGQGAYFAQYGAGNLMNVIIFNGTYYCFHATKTWALTIPADDTTSTNIPYRNNVGIPYLRAAYPVDDGALYLDYSDKSNPMVRMLMFTAEANNVLPIPISEKLDLSKNGFDAPVMFASGDLYFLACQGITNGTNDTNNDFTYIYNRVSSQWDKTDIPASCFANYKASTGVPNVILAGDPASNNVFQYFTGYDDDGSVINNYWISGATDLDTPGIKRANRFWIDGFINPAQSFDIYVQYDTGAFIKIGTISGTGSYVDSYGTLVGTDVVGTQVVGQGATANAFHFMNEFVFNSDIFEYIAVKFVATGVGALQVNSYGFKDLRFKGRRTIQRYQTTS